MLGARNATIVETLAGDLNLTYANKISIAFVPSSFDPVIVLLPTTKDMIELGHLCQWRAGELSQGVEEESVNDHAGPERAKVG